MNIVTAIPARFDSRRFPGKVLAEIHGKPLLQWTYLAAKKVGGDANTWIVTDDERVVEAAHGFDAPVLLTSRELLSGTDRVAALAKKVPADIYVNIQADEPLIDPDAVRQAIELVESGKFSIATIMTPLSGPEELKNLSVVKVVASLTGKALYFSRFPIPHSRRSVSENGFPMVARKHVGVYVYSAAILKQLAELPGSYLEQAESLEQLRALEYGIDIGVVEASIDCVAVDEPEDIPKVEKKIAEILQKQMDERRNRGEE